MLVPVDLLFLPYEIILEEYKWKYSQDDESLSHNPIQDMLKSYHDYESTLYKTLSFNFL